MNVYECDNDFLCMYVCNSKDSESAAAALASEYCNRLACEIEVLCVCAGYVCMHCMMKPMFVIG